MVSLTKLLRAHGRQNKLSTGISSLDTVLSPSAIETGVVELAAPPGTNINAICIALANDAYSMGFQTVWLACIKPPPLVPLASQNSIQGLYLNTLEQALAFEPNTEVNVIVVENYDLLVLQATESACEISKKRQDRRDAARAIIAKVKAWAGAGRLVLMTSTLTPRRIEYTKAREMCPPFSGSPMFEGIRRLCFYRTSDGAVSFNGGVFSISEIGLQGSTNQESLKREPCIKTELEPHPTQEAVPETPESEPWPHSWSDFSRPRSDQLESGDENQPKRMKLEDYYDELSQDFVPSSQMDDYR